MIGLKTDSIWVSILNKMPLWKVLKHRCYQIFSQSTYFHSLIWLIIFIGIYLSDNTFQKLLYTWPFSHLSKFYIGKIFYVERLVKRYFLQHIPQSKHLTKVCVILLAIFFSRDNEEKNLKSVQTFSGKMHANRAKRNCILHVYNLFLKYL